MFFFILTDFLSPLQNSRKLSVQYGIKKAVVLFLPCVIFSIFYSLIFPKIYFALHIQFSCAKPMELNGTGSYICIYKIKEDLSKNKHYKGCETLITSIISSHIWYRYIVYTIYLKVKFIPYSVNKFKSNLSCKATGNKLIMSFNP